MSTLVATHFAAVVLAALTLWSMRHEVSERAASPADWARPVVFAAATAAVLLMVSPGKRLDLWALFAGVGFAIGLAVGSALKAIKDFALNLVSVDRTWDGIVAGVLLLILALIRLVTTDITGRQSGGHGVLGGIAAFVAAYLFGRVITLYFYSARNSIHLDMVRGQRRHRTE